MPVAHVIFMDASDLHAPGGKVEPDIGEFGAHAEPIPPVKIYTRTAFGYVKESVLV